MFTPTEFPCTAWYVTPSLSLREVTLIGLEYTHQPDWFREKGRKGLLCRTMLFDTKRQAFDKSVAELDAVRQRVSKAKKRLDLLDNNVATTWEELLRQTEVGGNN